MQLKVQNLHCSRNQQNLFHHLNFELNRGDILHIGGPNGAGKSSLLKILCHLMSPQEGEVIWENKKDLLYIGHQLGVVGELTVNENFKFIRSLAPAKSVDSSEILAQLQLTPWQTTLCNKLSAGQRQKVALARLWLLNASAWILDEPFSSLDQETIAVVQKTCIDHLNAGGLIILSSHQPLSLSGINIRKLNLR